MNKRDALEEILDDFHNSFDSMKTRKKNAKRAIIALVPDTKSAEYCTQREADEVVGWNQHRFATLKAFGASQ